MNLKQRKKTPSIRFALLFMFCLLFASIAAQAQRLTWDSGSNGTNTGPNVIPGSGNWDSFTADWNTGTNDIAWPGGTSGNTTLAAIFAGVDGTNGAYQITNTLSPVVVSNLVFLNSGYEISGQSVSINSPSATGNFIVVANGKTATIDSSFNVSGSGLWCLLGSNSVVPTVGTPGPAVLIFNGSNALHNSSLYFISTNVGGAQVYFNNGALDSGGGNIIPYIDADCFITNGTAHIFNMFLARNSNQGPNYGHDGSLTVDGSNTVLDAAPQFSRGGGTSTLTMQNGATLNDTGFSTQNAGANICFDNSPLAHATFNVSSGATVNLGTPGQTIGFFIQAGTLMFMRQGSSVGESAVLNLSGGTINSAGGIQFGSSANGNAGGVPFIGTAQVNVTGGFLYLGPNGIYQGGVGPFPGGASPAVTVNLSGGTLGTLGTQAGWTDASVPLVLGTTNGNITFQCADSTGNPFDITLAGSLTGPGGFNKTGGGTLALTVSNNYAGSTVVSNGALVVTTAAGTTSTGPVTVDGSAGSPTLAVQLLNQGLNWSIGTLTFQNGATTLSNFFGSLSPSPTVAPIQVAGDLNLSATPPAMIVAGSALVVGTYPLITYTGNLSGTVPASVTLPGYCSGTIQNSPGTKSINLVITSSTAVPPLVWAVGSGLWDINTTANWKGSSTKYTDGNPVVFDDSASGTSPITLTLNTVVNPLSLSANNLSKTYIVSGTGSIAGAASVNVLGGGALTLATTNSFNGGTTVTLGQLNINAGGDSSGNDSAIGTGPLTINNGAVIDNTSGSNVTLVPAIQQTWNGNFTFKGSTNLNTGTNGSVTLGANVTISVNANNLVVPSIITDNSAGFGLNKAGSGALTLSGANSFGGNVSASQGVLNIGDPAATGTGQFIMNGGSIDNVSGAPITLGNSASPWNASFTFVGTTNLNLGNAQVSSTSQGNVTLTVLKNIFETDGSSAVGNGVFTKAGAGTWLLGGNFGWTGTVTGGTLALASPGGNAIAGSHAGLTVTSNALAFDNGAGTPQVSSANTVPITLALGGVFDLNGNSETFYSLAMSGGGTLLDSLTNSQSTLNIGAGNLALNDSNCVFNVASNSTLTLSGNILGTGSLTMKGAGELVLTTSNGYTGQTIIQSGTIAMPGSASLVSSSAIILSTNTSALDLTGNTDTNGILETLTLSSGQTLSGFGTVTGLVATASGSTVAPGSASKVGKLTVTGNPPGANSVNGALLLTLNRTNAQNCSTLVFTAGTVTYGGALSVSNIGPALHVGDQFHLFTAATSGFSAVNLPAADSHLYTYTWQNNVGVDGSVTVATAVAPTRTNILTSVSGKTLTLSWPLDHLGFILQTQTNTLAVGLGTNWANVAGSALVTSTNVTIGTNGTVFYRLVSP